LSVSPKIETGTADFVYIEATRSEIYFSTSADMDRNSPALGQEMFSVSVYPFSMEKNFLPFTLEIFSKNRPSITEPYAVYETRGENAYAARWQSETVACQDRWRHKNPFSMIYPWKETSPENMQIRRNCTVGENELTAEIEILLPSEGWDININCPSYSVKKEGISPAPDASGSSFVLYRNRGGEMGIRISYPKRLDIAGYYPEVVLKKKSITENRIIKTESGAMVSEDFSLQTEKIIETVVLAEVMEKKSAWLKRLTGDEKH